MKVWMLLRTYTVAVYIFMFAPVAVVLILAFNNSQFGGFPIDGFSLKGVSTSPFGLVTRISII